MADKEAGTFAKKEGRIIIRLFLIVLSFLLLQSGYDHYAPLVFGNDKPLPEGGSAGLLYFRNKRIDRLSPFIEQSDPSAYAADDVLSAVAYLKEFFQAQTIEYGLCAVRFKESDTQSTLRQLPDNGTVFLALQCDYNIFDDIGADKKGYYPNAVFVLKQEADGGWTLPFAEGAAIKSLVCPLEQHALSKERIIE